MTTNQSPEAPAHTGCQPRPMLPLTSLRFFAAFLVLTFHFGAGFLSRIGAPDMIANIFHNGYLGVSLFFVLSGFILSHAHQDDEFSGRASLRYALARFARVYPVYALALVLAYPLVHGSLTGTQAAAVLTMVQSWTPPASPLGFAWIMQAWTLSVEAFFYVLFPFLWLMLRRANAFVCLGVVLGSAAAIILLGLPSVSPGVEVIPLVGSGSAIWIPFYRLPEFVLGIALYRTMALYPGPARALGGSGAELALVGVIVLTLMLAQDVHSRALFTLFVGLLIVCLATGTGIVSRVLKWPLFVLLGGASYGIYILQGPLREYTRLLVPAPWDQFANPIVTVSLAIALFLGYEQPIRRRVVALFSRNALRSASPVGDVQSG